MSELEMTLPELGGNDLPMIVGAWLVRRGAEVTEGESILEVLAGAALVDIPAVADGVLIRKLVAEGDSLTVGQPLALIRRHMA